MNKQRIDEQMSFTLSKLIAVKLYEDGLYSDAEYEEVIRLLFEKYNPFIDSLLLE